MALFSLLLDDGKTIALQYAPESVSFSREAAYAEGETAGTDMQSQQWYLTRSPRKSYSDLLLDSWSKGISIKPVLEQLERLTVPRVFKSRLEPPVVTALFGEDRFGPCRLVSLSYTETGWLPNGQVARARVSFDLIQIPPTDADPTKRGLNNNQAASGLNIKRSLTDREVASAAPGVNEYLKTNVGKYAKDVQALIKAGRYSVKTNRTSGEVQILEQNKVVGTVGTWTGTRLDTKKETLTKVKSTPSTYKTRG